jgi:hypothetical protein
VEDMCYERQRAEARDLRGLVCPSRSSECGGEGDCVKEGGGGDVDDVFYLFLQKQK